MFSKQVFILLFLALITRFIGLDWGNGIFYHPDENNMASSLSRLSTKDLDPHFYAYGQFPVYLGFFALKILGLPNTFPNSIYALRAISALSGMFSFLVFYKIIQKVDRNSAFLASLIYIFLPGNIQLSHFGTTESILILFYLLIFYFSPKSPLLASIFLGLATGIKISSLVFAIPIFLSILKHKNIRLFIASLLIFGIFVFLSSPYNFLNQKDFLSSLRYETQVARGDMAVFYTNQFRHTTPYLFQAQKVFPFALGLPVFVLSFLAISRFKFQKNLLSLSILITSLVYFLYFGQLYTKWFRFMSPVFFIGPLLVGIYLSKIKNNLLKYLLLLICILPGALFFTRYLSVDVRTQVNDYIQANMGESYILSEAGNVANLVDTQNFDFYNLDTNPDLQKQLQEELRLANYIIVPSRRMYANQNNPEFPYSQAYYVSLFSGQLGFRQIKSFSFYSKLLNPELLAEETFTVFDTPTIRIFQKKYEN